MKNLIKISLLFLAINSIESMQRLKDFVIKKTVDFNLSRNQDKVRNIINPRYGLLFERPKSQFEKTLAELKAFVGEHGPHVLGDSVLFEVFYNDDFKDDPHAIQAFLDFLQKQPEGLERFFNYEYSCIMRAAAESNKEVLAVLLESFMAGNFPHIPHERKQRLLRKAACFAGKKGNYINMEFLIRSEYYPKPEQPVATTADDASDTKNAPETASLLHEQL